ncbi:MAG TPA: GSCFA domain-containing protein [Bacteroidales bacterium]
MELRTTFPVGQSQNKIGYNTPVMFIGSCFASSIGAMLEMGKIPVMINPAGAVYNPVSVCNTLDTITSQRVFSQDDLYNYDGTYLSFYHYTDFSSDDPSEVLLKINKRSKEAFDFLNRARFLFITFGTARVYRWNETGQIVSNCHKIPANRFERELLTVNDIVSLWSKQLDKFKSLFPYLKIVFTISPVRHWKDGAHGNQLSKSILFLAVEDLLKHSVSPQYFPAYELMMDDLRDYRFYDEDMLHPSSVAINYIWNSFSACYMENKTMNVWDEAVRITKACNHRFNKESKNNTMIFAERMLRQITETEGKIPSIDLSKERKYFLNLLIK